jgi:hypothetical protein
MPQYSTQNNDHMKTSFFLTAFCLISLSAFLVYSKLDLNRDNTSITITENDDTYTFSASFNKSNTGTVERYINTSIKPNSLAGSENDYFDASTSLIDKTTFHIKESPGKLEIKLDKRKNSNASYFRIRKMCDGIKELLAGK